jgi:hypothetical protein
MQCICKYEDCHNFLHIFDLWLFFEVIVSDQEVEWEAKRKNKKLRKSLQLSNRLEISEKLSHSKEQMSNWKKYRTNFSYAQNISYDDVIDSLRQLLRL